MLSKLQVSRGIFQKGRFFFGGESLQGASRFKAPLPPSPRERKPVMGSSGVAGYSLAEYKIKPRVP